MPKKLFITLLVEGRGGIKYLRPKLFFFERVRDFFDEIFKQSSEGLKSYQKSQEPPRKINVFGENTLRAPFNLTKIQLLNG